MKYTRFEELPVWKAALHLASHAYSLTAQPPFRGQYSLRDQLERAAVSISNNIAEGFERGTTKEFSPSCTSPAVPPGKCGPCSVCWKFFPISLISNLKFQI